MVTFRRRDTVSESVGEHLWGVGFPLVGGILASVDPFALVVCLTKSDLAGAELAWDNQISWTQKPSVSVQEHHSAFSFPCILGKPLFSTY